MCRLLRKNRAVFCQYPHLNFSLKQLRRNFRMYMHRATKSISDLIAEVKPKPKLNFSVKNKLIYLCVLDQTKVQKEIL